MTTYTPILNAEVDAESPITDLLLTRLRDNPLAIANGNADAPRVNGFALVPDSKAVADGKVLTVSASDAYSLTVGLTRVFGIAITTSLTDRVAVTITANFIDGVIRFKASHFASNASHSSDISFFKNGVLVSSFTTSSTSPVARTIDSAVAVNDVFEWRHRASSFGTSNVSLTSETASDAYSRIGALLKESDL
jgi:hypothetical protein